MIKLVRFELWKLFKRKDTLFLFLILIMPVFYSVGLASGTGVVTYTSSVKLDGLSFVDSMYQFVYMLVFFIMLLVFCAANTLRGEIDNRSIAVLLQRVNNRKSIYFSKIISIYVFMLIITIVFVLVSLICYFFVLDSTDITRNTLYLKGTAMMHIKAIFSLFMYYMLCTSVAMCLSVFVKKTLATIIFFVGFIVGFYLKVFSMVKYISPQYYLDRVLEVPRSASGDGFLLLVLTFGAVIVAFNYIGVHKFSKCDIQ